MTRFTDRALLKVYIERSDLEKLTARSVESKQVVSEYVRDLILEHLSENGDSQDLRRPSPVRLVESGTRPFARVAGSAGKTADPCKHGALPELCRYEECRRKAVK
jgi:hypothetical protein